TTVHAAPPPFKRGYEPPVDGFHLLRGDFPLRQPRLVGNHREEKPFPGKEAQRVRGSRQDADGGRIAQVSDLLDERAVPVEENDPPQCSPRKISGSPTGGAFQG